MARGFGAAAVDIQPILEVPAQPAMPGLGVAAAPPATWFRVRGVELDANPWDAAHAHLQPGQPFAAAAGGAVETVEPDLAQDWFEGTPEEPKQAKDEAELCTFDQQDPSGTQATGPKVA